MSPLEIIADVLFVIAAGLGIAAAAMVSTALAFVVACGICLVAAIILTLLALKRPTLDRNSGSPFREGS